MNETPAERDGRLAREAEVAVLIAKANDPADPYDGHHGTDRTEDSLEYAEANRPEVAAKIRERLARDGGAI